MYTISRTLYKQFIDIIVKGWLEYIKAAKIADEICGLIESDTTNTTFQKASAIVATLPHNWFKNKSWEFVPTGKKVDFEFIKDK